MTDTNNLINEMWDWITSQSDHNLPKYLCVERWKIFHMAQTAGIDLACADAWQEEAERIHEDTGEYPWED